jgi:hypothetical protein
VDEFDDAIEFFYGLGRPLSIAECLEALGLTEPDPDPGDVDDGPPDDPTIVGGPCDA